MRNQWRWFGVVGAILAAAFLFPRVALWIEQANAEERVLSYGMGTLLNFDALKLAEKQSLLASGELTVIDEQHDNPQEILTHFHEELRKLYDCGVLNKMIYEISCDLFRADAASIFSYLAFDNTGTKSFRYYEIISNVNEASAYYDLETGKVLQLSFFGYANEIFDLREEKANTTGEEVCEAQLRSWAEYYGMSVQALSIEETENYDLQELVLGKCIMQDELGDAFGFSLTFNEYSATLTWRSIPEEYIKEVEETSLMQDGK